MMMDFLKRLLLMFLFTLAHALVFRRIHVFDFATPLFYVYFVFLFPRNYPRWAMLLWCFFMGLGIDIFSNTPGVASASMTLVGVLQPIFLNLFLPRDAEENMPVSAAMLGIGKYVTLVLALTFVYCIVHFTLESFSLFNWGYWLASIFGTTLLTSCLIFAFEGFRK